MARLSLAATLLGAAPDAIRSQTIPTQISLAPGAAGASPTQFFETVPAPVSGAPGPVGLRRVQIFPRSDVGPQAEFLPTPGGESVIVVSGGVNLVVQGLEVEGYPALLGPLGNVDVETDRAVIWTAGLGGGGLGQFTQSSDTPLEIYMEGNIIFRQGDRTVYADRMYYDVRRQVGVILNAELLTPLPEVGGYQYRGLIRLKAAAIRQLDASRFVASDALLTTSRLEVPAYDVSSETITFTDIQQPVIDPASGLPAIDPLTGEPAVVHQQLAESRGNALKLDGVPIFYWPTLTTNLEKPSYFVDNFRVRNDSIFGTQVLLELDAFQLFGIPVAPAGTDWNLNLDYLSKRGLGFGSTLEYGRDDFFDIQGPVSGLADAWFIKDNGLDNLGLLRREIVPEESFRGRVFWNHRQRLRGGPLDDWVLQAEVGWISDRTFLEQYYEAEWDQQPDQLTGVRLKKSFDNQAVSVELFPRVNDFFTQTQWLPRADHWWLGQSLLDDTVTWYEHSQAAYANIGIASTPTNPTLAGQFERFPWEENAAGAPVSARGERLITRQEFDLPLDFAPFKVVPYVLGEAGHWGQDVGGNDIQRLYLQTGARASIPFWSVNPAMRDPLFNLNGLAHKVVFDAEIAYSESTQNLNQFPLYDSLDDDAIEEFRRRMFFTPFGGNLAGTFYVPGAPSAIDPKFDPRFYALRAGQGSYVTSPASEIADDLLAVRLGMRHRLQTKRGAVGSQRIVDWLIFDANATLFPNAARDNFGQQLGTVDYDLQWHIGDRFTVLSDGFAETFGGGLRTASIGGLLNRPSRGNIYLGYRNFSGLIESDTIIAAVNYRSTPKWIVSASALYDIRGVGNSSQNFGISRIGESVIASLSTRYNESKDNFSVGLLVEPRFLPRTQLTRKTGIDVPPAGAFFLE